MIQRQEARNKREHEFLSRMKDDFERVLDLKLDPEQIKAATSSRYYYLSRELKQEFDLGILIMQVDDDGVPYLVEISVDEPEKKIDLSGQKFRERVGIRDCVNIEFNNNWTRSEVFECIYEALYESCCSS